GGKHMREAQACETDILIVKVGHVGFGNVFAVDADVDKNTCRAAQTAARIENVSRRAFYHRDEIWQRYRGNQGVVTHHNIVRESQQLRARIDRDQLMVKIQVSEGDKLIQVGYKAAMGRIAEVCDVMDLRG